MILTSPDQLSQAGQATSGFRSSTAQNSIELLSVSLLEQNRHAVIELKKLARSLRLEFGWHYLLDLTWTIRLLGSVQGKQILDAGAGTGILQWYLADAGAQVISVDRLSRAALPPRFRQRYKVKGLRQSDLLSPWQSFTSILCRPVNGPFHRKWAARFVALLCEAVGYLSLTRSMGNVIIYNQQLDMLADLPDNSMDAIVAISSLEHNSPEGLEIVVAELMRVLKPSGILLATLTAARDQDWWHNGSSGWCYTESSLHRIFKFPPEVSSNYHHYDEYFAALQDCAELRDNLARFYYQSEDKGMPRGAWNPEYQPVGICKIKRA